VPSSRTEAPAEVLRRALAGPADVGAPLLLGALLVREDTPRVAGDPGEVGDPGQHRLGRIVEVEAYGGPEDRASHARFGLTVRTRSMFGAPGRAYVYGVYGMHTCINIVSGPAGSASAILVRAVEPLAGIPLMRAARVARAVATRRADAADPRGAARRLARVADPTLARGPGNVAAAFDITRADDGLDLLDPASPLRLEIADGWTSAAGSSTTPAAVTSGPRVGVAYAGPGWADLPWRFWLAGNPAVSGPR
jgi:DNA-3-methyladenine glycosylase